MKKPQNIIKAMFVLCFITSSAVVLLVADEEANSVSKAVSKVSDRSFSAIVDQSQEGTNYGFWFEKDVVRWQEFTPQHSVLPRIDLYIDKRGSPGDMRVALNDTQDRLWETIIPEADVDA
ncbi:MAG: hypothetical protein ACFFBD_05985 [Candidatus Hodarchaeota archaeon]